MIAASASMLAASGGLLDPTALLEGAGPWVLVVIIAMIFIETGLLFPFLPGDSLVFTAALLSVPLGIPLYVLIPVVAVTAILGDTVGFEIGRRYGRRFFAPDARVLKTEYLDRANDFFEKYGGRSLVLARFVPIVRTFIPPIVGMSTMRYRTFLMWNAIGGIGWTVVCSLAGYLLGHIPAVRDNVDLISIGIVAVSVLPIAFDLLRKRAKRPVKTESAQTE